MEYGEEPEDRLANFSYLLKLVKSLVFQEA